MVIKSAVSLHRDFFIVLDLRLTKRLVDYREVKHLSSFIGIYVKITQRDIKSI